MASVGLREISAGRSAGAAPGTAQGGEPTQAACRRRARRPRQPDPPPPAATPHARAARPSRAAVRACSGAGRREPGKRLRGSCTQGGAGGVAEALRVGGERQATRGIGARIAAYLSSGCFRLNSDQLCQRSNFSPRRVAGDQTCRKQSFSACPKLTSMFDIRGLARLVGTNPLNGTGRHRPVTE